MNTAAQNTYRKLLIHANRLKREQREWIFRINYAGGTYMRVGVVHNKSRQSPLDVICIEILNADNELLEWEMRIDEAQGLIFGLSKVLTGIMIGDGRKGRFLKEYYEFCKITDKKRD